MLWCLRYQATVKRPVYAQRGHSATIAVIRVCLGFCFPILSGHKYSAAKSDLKYREDSNSGDSVRELFVKSVLKGEDGGVWLLALILLGKVGALHASTLMIPRTIVNLIDHRNEPIGGIPFIRTVAQDTTLKLPTIYPNFLQNKNGVLIEVKYTDDRGSITFEEMEFDGIISINNLTLSVKSSVSINCPEEQTTNYSPLLANPMARPHYQVNNNGLWISGERFFAVGLRSIRALGNTLNILVQMTEDSAFETQKIWNGFVKHLNFNLQKNKECELIYMNK